MTETTHAPELPAYECHKVVRAARIAYADLAAGTIAIEWPTVGGVKGGSAVLTGKGALMARRTPAAGDYYVVYDDGYDSVSPKKAFEAGYASCSQGAEGRP